MAATYTVERSATLDAPPAAVWAQLVDFRNWTRWSPWEELDPALERTYSGTQKGVGAIYAWSGNKKAGQGRMEIWEAVPERKLRIQLVFQRPFKSRNVTTFSLAPDGNRTRVSWQMMGPNPLLMRLFGFAFNVDRLIGKDFEKGLANLERAARPASP